MKVMLVLTTLLLLGGCGPKMVPVNTEQCVRRLAQYNRDLSVHTALTICDGSKEER